MEAVRQVHSYVDELARTSAEAPEGHPTAVADIGDPGEPLCLWIWLMCLARLQIGMP